MCFKPVLVFYLLARMHLYFLGELDREERIESVLFWVLACLATQSMAFLFMSLLGDPGYTAKKSLTTNENIIQQVY
jgi:hypothetical protein